MKIQNNFILILLIILYQILFIKGCTTFSSCKECTTNSCTWCIVTNNCVNYSNNCTALITFPKNDKKNNFIFTNCNNIIQDSIQCSEKSFEQLIVQSSQIKNLGNF
jgi:hypothetical protein